MLTEKEFDEAIVEAENLVAEVYKEVMDEYMRPRNRRVEDREVEDGREILSERDRAEAQDNITS